MLPRSLRSVGVVVAVAAIIAGCSSSATLAPSAAPATAATTSAPTSGAPASSAAATAAASSAAPASSAPAESASAASSATAAATAAASSAASPVVGSAGASGVLNVQLFDAVDSFFPWGPTGTYSDSLMMSLQWDFLAAYDETGKPEMRLADSITSSPDSKTWTVKLKPGLQWSDGTPLTSKDVVFTWKVNANPNQSYNSGLWKGIVGMTDWQKGPDFSKDIPGITAPDDQTVVFQLTDPNAAFLDTLLNFRNMILPSAQLLAAAPKFYSLSNKDVWALPMWTAPTVGEGPYLFEKWEQGQFLSFTPNPHWRGGPLAFSQVVAKIITDRSVAAAQLQAGALDVGLINLDDLDGMSSAGFQTGFAISPPPEMTVLNNSPLSPFHDVKVRQAFMYGCDRQGFVDSFLHGKALKADSYFFPDWVSKDGIPVYNYDPAKAKQLLDSANFDYSRTLNWVVYDKDDKAMNASAQDCQSKMGELGVKIQILNGLDVETKNRTDGTYDLDSYGYYSVLDPDSITIPFTCHSETPVPANGYFGTGPNESNYCNKDFDALMAQGRAVSDQAARAKIYEQAQAIWMQDVPSMIQYRNATPYAWSPKIQGFTPYGDPGQAWLKISQWSKSS